MFEKKRVKILEPIAGLADPDRKALDQKYRKLEDGMRSKAAEQNRTLKPETIKAFIDQHKAQDRYDDVCRGFQRDFAFKPDQEAMIPAEVAQMWEDAGICVILPDLKKVAA